MGHDDAQLRHRLQAWSQFSGRTIGGVQTIAAAVQVIRESSELRAQTLAAFEHVMVPGLKARRDRQAATAEMDSPRTSTEARQGEAVDASD
jgi:hypothetical protein